MAAAYPLSAGIHLVNALPAPASGLNDWMKDYAMDLMVVVPRGDFNMCALIRFSLTSQPRKALVP